MIGVKLLWWEIRQNGPLFFWIHVFFSLIFSIFFMYFCNSCKHPDIQQLDCKSLRCRYVWEHPGGVIEGWCGHLNLLRLLAKSYDKHMNSSRWKHKNIYQHKPSMGGITRFSSCNMVQLSVLHVFFCLAQSKPQHRSETAEKRPKRYAAALERWLLCHLRCGWSRWYRDIRGCTQQGLPMTPCLFRVLVILGLAILGLLGTILHFFLGFLGSCCLQQWICKKLDCVWVWKSVKVEDDHLLWAVKIGDDVSCHQTLLSSLMLWLYLPF